MDYYGIDVSILFPFRNDMRSHVATIPPTSVLKIHKFFRKTDVRTPEIIISAWFKFPDIRILAVLGFTGWRVSSFHTLSRRSDSWERQRGLKRRILQRAVLKRGRSISESGRGLHPLFGPASPLPPPQRRRHRLWARSCDHHSGTSAGPFSHHTHSGKGLVRNIETDYGIFSSRWQEDWSTPRYWHFYSQSHTVS